MPTGFVQVTSQQLIKLVLFSETGSHVSQASPKLYVAKLEVLILLPLLECSQAQFLWYQ